VSSLRQMSTAKTETTALSPDMARRAAGIVAVLDKLYPEPPVPLNHNDDFTFLCAVVLCKCGVCARCCGVMCCAV
jgi:hypothetical protein